MKIADMGNMDSHKAGRTVAVCRGWHYMDGYRWDGNEDFKFRYIYHYGSLMAVITRTEHEGVTCDGFVPQGVGHGSVSDQNGMNRIMQRLGVPMRYRRDGGDPRYEDWFGGQTYEGGE